MSQQDQWRFQWPDGTWIRWNPLTQSWEKESPDDPGGAGTPLTTVVAEEGDAIVEVEERAPDTNFVPEPSQPPNGRAAEEPERRDESDPHGREPQQEELEPLRPRSERRASETGRVRRMVGDVVSEEEAEPRGSMWPTIVVGAVAGVGIGLVVLEVMRG